MDAVRDSHPWCQGLPTVSAKHVAAQFGDVVERWRKAQEALVPSSLRGRPCWARTEVRGLNGMNLFCKEQGLPPREGQAAWAALSVVQQSGYRHRAKGPRTVRRLATTDAAGTISAAAAVEGQGPWGIGSLSGPWPITPYVVGAAMSSKGAFNATVAQWNQDGTGSGRNDGAK